MEKNPITLLPSSQKARHFAPERSAIFFQYATIRRGIPGKQKAHYIHYQYIKKYTPLALMVQKRNWERQWK